MEKLLQATRLTGAKKIRRNTSDSKSRRVKNVEGEVRKKDSRWGGGEQVPKEKEEGLAFSHRPYKGNRGDSIIRLNHYVP